MAGLYTEADYENSVVELFKNMGYTYVYGPDIERDFKSPLYDDVLVESLHRINKGLPEDAITDALYMMIKKLLKKHKYPPEGMDDAVQTVMTQCELWTDNADFS